MHHRAPGTIAFKMCVPNLTDLGILRERELDLPAIQARPVNLATLITIDHHGYVHHVSRVPFRSDGVISRYDTEVTTGKLLAQRRKRICNPQTSQPNANRRSRRQSSRKGAPESFTNSDVFSTTVMDDILKNYLQLKIRTRGLVATAHGGPEFRAIRKAQ